MLRHPARVVRQHEDDLASVVRVMRDFNDRQSHLFFLMLTFLARYPSTKSRYTELVADRSLTPELGSVRDEDVTRIADHFTEPGKITFRTLVCGASLKVFSDPLGCDAESWTERDTAREVEQDSGQSSNQVSGS